MGHGLSNIPAFSAAFNRRGGSETERPLAIASWTRDLPEEPSPGAAEAPEEAEQVEEEEGSAAKKETIEKLFPYSAGDTTFAFILEYPWCSPASGAPTRELIIRLRNSFVQRGRLSLFAHLQYGTVRMMVVFDEGGSGAVDLAPLKLALYGELRGAYFFARKPLIAYFIARLLDFTHARWQELMALAAEHAIFAKQVILRSVADTDMAMLLWALEHFVWTLEPWGEDAARMLAVCYPLWACKEHWCKVVINLGNGCQRATKDEVMAAIAVAWKPRREAAKSDVIPAVEKAMQLVRPLPLRRQLGVGVG